MTTLKTGKHFDFVPEAAPAGSGLDPATIQVIESNTKTQVNVKQNYTEITWVNGLPSLIEKYANNTKAQKLWTITPTFVDGLPTQIVAVNEDDAVTETTTLVFVNGVPITITKV